MGNLMESINALMLNSFVLGVLLTILVELAIYVFIQERNFSSEENHQDEKAQQVEVVIPKSKIRKVVTDGHEWLEVSRD